MACVSLHPEVSVIIPVFNAAPTLEETLISVAGQTLSNIEIIVVDDGSTDATPDVLAAFANKEPRLRVIRQSNSGVAEARNLAIREARAPYIAPIDADDLWHPTYLEKLFCTLDAAGPETVLAYANHRRLNPDGEVEGTAPNYNLSGHVLRFMLLRNIVGNGSAMMYRRDAVLRVGAYDRRLQHEFASQGCEDWLLQLRLAAFGKAVAVPEYLVGYRILPNAMSSHKLRMWNSHIHSLDIFFSETDCRDTQVGRWSRGLILAETAFCLLTRGRIFGAIALISQAAPMDPVGTVYAGVVSVVRRARALYWRFRHGLRSKNLRRFETYHPKEDPVAMDYPALSDRRVRRVLNEPPLAVELDRSVERGREARLMQVAQAGVAVSDLSMSRAKSSVKL